MINSIATAKSLSPWSEMVDFQLRFVEGSCISATVLDIKCFFVSEVRSFCPALAEHSGSDSFFDLTSCSGTSLLNPTSCSETTFVTSCGLTSFVFATSCSVRSCNVYLLCILYHLMWHLFSKCNTCGVTCLEYASCCERYFPRHTPCI